MRYYAMIITATIIWGSTFVLVKDVTEVMGPAWLVGIRFALAAVILALFFFKERSIYLDKRNALYGCVCGFVLFAGYYVQTVGVTDTTPGKNAFLTATYCVIVPFSAWLLMRRRPTRFSIAGAAIALTGIGLISLNGNFTMRFGDALSLGCAFFFALHITLISMLTSEKNALAITIWQFAVVGACGLTVAGLTEPIPDLAQFDVGDVLAVGYLTVFATALALLMQNTAQPHMTPATASLILTFESVFGASFSILLGAEELTLRLFVGFALVFSSVLVAEVLPAWLDKRLRLAAETAS